MPKPLPTEPATSLSLGAVARLTGLSPELLRAWERRYRAIEPLRTPGGTRRYRPADLARLRLLKAAADAGHRIGQVAGLGDDELARLLQEPEALSAERQDEVLEALDALDAPEAQRLLSLQLGALGPLEFARGVALPLVREIGQRWSDGRMDIASEHLATGVLRSLLGAALRPGAAALRGPRVLFATLPGERHELGLLMAALAALAAGANPIYLGAEVPVPDLCRAAQRCSAAAVALSLVASPIRETQRALRALRAGLAPGVRIWVGGAHADAAAALAGVERLIGLEGLETHVREMNLYK
jgi:DNA-binding transcriptional MerR regulator/methylmalonyl-CoA mutase cobalamin-binding subunit